MAMQPRRTFLQNASAATALSYSRVLGANDRIRVAGLGTGGRCRYLLSVAKQHPDVDIVAACDVYEPRRLETIAKLAPTAKEYVEYREVLERKDIDAVFIGSPDHWHVPMTIDAVRAGKAVYVEKPLTKTIEEGALVEKAVKESGCVVQVGYQQRSWEHFVAARDIVASGKLGKVTLILASWYQNYVRNDARKAILETSKLDRKRWLGNAPDQEVTALKYARWRWFWDFGGGHLTDLYSHYCDVIHWYMGADIPSSALTMGGRFMLDYLECPDTINTSYLYPGFQVVYQGTMVCHLEGGNIIFRGSQAMMKINRDGYDVYPEGIVPPEKTTYPPPALSAQSAHDGSIDHVRNFLECVRSRKTPNAPVSSSVATARAAHIGNLAYRNGGRFDWKA
jgi:predicted dehydrogenase